MGFSELPGFGMSNKDFYETFKTKKDHKNDKKNYKPNTQSHPSISDKPKKKGLFGSKKGKFLLGAAVVGAVGFLILGKKNKEDAPADSAGSPPPNGGGGKPLSDEQMAALMHAANNPYQAMYAPMPYSSTA